MAFHADEDFRTHADVWSRFITASIWSGAAIAVALAILAAAVL